MSKVKRKVTVEKDSDEPRRPSVFERLGPGAAGTAPQATDRHSRSEQNEKCRQWLRTGNCAYGPSCRYEHEPLPASSRQRLKSEKDVDMKDLRRKVKPKKEEKKKSRSGSASPKRKPSKRSRSRSRKGDHDSKIKSSVVVARPSAAADGGDPKKKGDGTWEDDSDDWPIDAAQLDYKEELTLERKRQQLQRELELELQKERMMNENVTISKTVNFSESSSSSSSSESGSVSTSSVSSSSSSDEESNSSTSSSSSSSGSRAVVKKKTKRHSKEIKHKEEHERAKSARSGKTKKGRSPSPQVEGRKGSRKGRDKRHRSPMSPRKKVEGRAASPSRSNVRLRGPRTPSPPAHKSRKQRQWAQSSSADNRAVDTPRSRGKKKKKDLPRAERRKHGVLAPPRLSSPNRLALSPGVHKKAKQREGKSRHRGRDASPPLLPQTAALNPTRLVGASRYLPPEEKLPDRGRLDDRPKEHPRKGEEPKRTDSRDRGRKRDKFSPHKETGARDRYESEVPIARKVDRRRSPVSPVRSDHRVKGNAEVEKKRENARRDDGYDGEGFDKRDSKVKRYSSPNAKKPREEKGHTKNMDYDSGSWQGDHRKPGSSNSRTPEPRSRQELRQQPAKSQRDRSREGEHERKKSAGKKRDGRAPEDVERRLSPRRSPSPLLSHHATREIDTLVGGNRGRLYESELPPAEREYSYSFDSLHDPYLGDRLPPPPEYEPDVLLPPYADTYPESRYRRGGKDSLDRYEPRDILSPRSALQPRDAISLTGREEYIGDLPIENRSYEERWPRETRGRGRDDWDPYPATSAAPLPPPHAALDEDRYGMPRRRRASPEWQRNRGDSRDSRQGNRNQLPPREGRSRSPKNRSSWNDRQEGRNREGRTQDDPGSKSVDEKKSRNLKRDRSKVKEEPQEEAPPKERTAVKRPHSPPVSPPVKPKRKRMATQPCELMKYHGGASAFVKKAKTDESRADSKSSGSSRTQKSTKPDASPPKVDSETPEVSSKSTNEKRSREKEDRKPRRSDDAARKEDNFSDWSDDDDDLLTRDDFVESEAMGDGGKSKHKVVENVDESSNTSSRRRERTKESSDSKKDKSSRTSSKDKVTEETAHSKDKTSSDHKEIEAQESTSQKDDTATDVDEYITAESVDYDPISDDELDALIEEPDDSLLKQPVESEKSKIVDALDVDWSALMNDTKITDFQPGFARERFKTAHVLSRIGFSQVLAGAELSGKIIDFCQKQIEAENERPKETEEEAEGIKKSFEMEHPIAAFHVSVSQNKHERIHLFNKVGPYRRALCARRDLQIRKLLCKPINKLAAPVVNYTPQYTVVDKELYKQSLELLKRPPVQPPVVCV